MPKESIATLFMDLRASAGNLNKDIDKAMGRTKRQLIAHSKVAGAALTAGITAGLASLSREWIAYNKAMLEVGTIADASAAQMESLRLGVLSTSAALGTDATESARALYQALSAGVPKENSIEFLKVASSLAIAGVTDTATAVDGLTNVINAFKLDTSDASAVADDLFTAVKLGKTTVEELSKNLSKASVSSKALGISHTELLASFISITKQGTNSAEAFTQMNALTTALVKPTKELQAAYDEMGVSSAAAAIQSEGLASFMGRLVASFDGNQTAMVKALSSTEAYKAALATTGENAAEVAASMEELNNNTGAASKAMRESSNDLGIAWQKTTSSLQLLNEELGITAGLAAYLTKAAEGAAFLAQGGAYTQKTTAPADLAFWEAEQKILQSVHDGLTASEEELAERLSLFNEAFAKRLEIARIEAKVAEERTAAEQSLLDEATGVTAEKERQAQAQLDATTAAITANADALKMAAELLTTEQDQINAKRDKLRAVIDSNVASEEELAIAREALGVLNAQADAVRARARAEAQAAALSATQALETPAERARRSAGEREGDIIKGFSAGELSADQRDNLLKRNAAKLQEDLNSIDAAGNAHRAAAAKKAVADRKREAENLQREQQRAAEEAARAWEYANRRVSDSFADAFLDGITGAENFGDAMKNVLRDIGRSYLKNNISSLFQGGINALTGGAGANGNGGGFFGSVFGGLIKGFADGGRPPSGQVSLVGERGAELFVPDRPGTIIPNHLLGGLNAQPTAAPSVTVVQNFSAGVTHAELSAVLPKIKSDTMQGVLDAVSRGGGFRKQLQA